MFRLTQYMREVLAPTPLGQKRTPPGPVVIWNLTRRCNLTCKHCYALAVDKAFPGELSTDDCFDVLEDLRAAKVPALILSGGEPMVRNDLFKISARAKELGLYVALSTNGTLIDAENVKDIAAADYGYVGISIDGTRDTHDAFRRKVGAFDASMKGVRLCVAEGLKVGLRFTMTQDNAHDLPDVLGLMDSEGVDRFYFSHLNYAGRGNHNRKTDAFFKLTRDAVTLLFDRCLADLQAGRDIEYVTGNNDADAVWFLKWVEGRFPDRLDDIRARLEQWGGNASGLYVANIDNIGNVHPDTMWWHKSIGNVRERAFDGIWGDISDPLMAGLKQQPRAVKGRCGACAYLNVCGGNTRVRAEQITGDPWEEDPACYLDDDEIGVTTTRERVVTVPFSATKRLKKAG